MQEIKIMEMHVSRNRIIDTIKQMDDIKFTWSISKRNICRIDFSSNPSITFEQRDGEVKENSV